MTFFFLSLLFSLTFT